MPTYSFVLSNGVPLSAGDEVLADDAEAQKVAEQIARDFAKNKVAFGRLRISVINKMGDKIHEAFVADLANPRHVPKYGA